MSKQSLLGLYSIRVSAKSNLVEWHYARQAPWISRRRSPTASIVAVRLVGLIILIGGLREFRVQDALTCWCETAVIQENALSGIGTLMENFATMPSSSDQYHCGYGHCCYVLLGGIAKALWPLEILRALRWRYCSPLGGSSKSILYNAQAAHSVPFGVSVWSWKPYTLHPEPSNSTQSPT